MIYREQIIELLNDYGLATSQQGFCADAILALPDPVHEAARELEAGALLRDARIAEDRYYVVDAEPMEALRAALAAERVPVPITDERALAIFTVSMQRTGNTKASLREVLDAALNGGS